MRECCSPSLKVDRMRLIKTNICWLLLLFCVATTAISCAAAAPTLSGDWVMKHSNAPGTIEFSLIESHKGGRSSHESGWPLSAFQGLDTTKSGRQDVHFAIVRDAGRFECDGYLNNGEGAGLFHFYPDAAFPAKMQAMGFSGVDEEKQFAMAIQDVTLAFAEEIQNEHLQGVDTDKVIAFRIFGVNAAFIQEMRAAGLKASDSDKLVAFRIHGVTPAMVRFLHQAGYTPNEDTLIAMRIHGVTPEWMEQLEKDGYDHVDLDKLIAFRIHGVSPEFIEKLRSLGYTHPDPDQLIAMRIHGVTPQFIAALQSRGMQNLSIDQLVSMKIHGID